MSDEAGDLNAKELPIPSAERVNVFVADGVPDEALPRWISQAGESNFMDGMSKRQPAEFCGMAIFYLKPGQRGVREGYLSGRVSEQLAPFYERAGSEANVFEWNPIERNFVRRDRYWFNQRQTKDTN